MKTLRDYLIKESVQINLDLFHQFFYDALAFEKDEDYEKADSDNESYFGNKWNKALTIINNWFTSNSIKSIKKIGGEYCGIDKDKIANSKIADNYSGLDEITKKIKLKYNSDLIEEFASQKLTKVVLTNNGSYSSKETYTLGLTNDSKTLYVKFNSNTTNDPYIRGSLFKFIKK